MTDTIVRRAGEQHITPFWNRIPQLFLYALSPRPLLTMLGLAAITALGWLVPLLGIPAVVLAMLAFRRYCYSVLERVAFGQLSAAGHHASDYGRYHQPGVQTFADDVASGADAAAAHPACDVRRAAAGRRHSIAAHTVEPVERPSLGSLRGLRSPRPGDPKSLLCAGNL